MDDRRPCPKCGGLLVKLGEREEPTSPIGIDRFIYICSKRGCRRVWTDDLDGEPLKEQTS